MDDNNYSQHDNSDIQTLEQLDQLVWRLAGTVI